MEGMQYITHRVVDGEYVAVMYWKVVDGIVYIKNGKEWTATEIPVEFRKDYEPTLDRVVLSHE